MNNNLRSALIQGLIVFLAASLGGMLLSDPLIIKKYIPLFIFGSLTLGIARAIAVYFYKKNTIEDERLINMRQKAQSIWFNVMLVGITFVTELIIIYANYIDNPTIKLDTASVPLDIVAWTFMTPLLGACAISLIGSVITEKILMKSHEK